MAPIEAWFTQQSWTPLPFQRQAWQAYLAGESGLIQVPTGSGKTYAAVMGPIAEMLNLAPPQPTPPRGLRLLYLTPLRALSRDLALAIRAPIEAMGWPPAGRHPQRATPPSQERGKQAAQPAPDPDHHARNPQPAAGQCQGS